jgi:hypothetical protein
METNIILYFNLINQRLGVYNRKRYLQDDKAKAREQYKKILTG